MKTLEKPTSIIFDMDGTLWDAVGPYAMAFNDFFKENAINKKFTKQDLDRYMGLEEDCFLEMVFPAISPEERKENYKTIIDLQYKRIDSDGGHLYEGVKEGLARLAQKYPLFIVSNCPEKTIQHFMKWAGVSDYVTDFMAHGMNYKPKHENIKYLMDKHQLESTIYIGDTDSDRKQCDLLNIPFGFVSYGFGHSKDYALKFDCFEEVERYFMQI